MVTKMDWRIREFQELDSTNQTLQELSAKEKEGLVVVADRQRLGRGRRGRTWESQEGNAYFSLLLKPQTDTKAAPMLTLVAAYSLAKYLRSKMVDCEIKWPNDLVVNGKKICGILTEMTLDGSRIAAVIVGIGVNLVPGTIPPELCDVATSIEEACGVRLTRQELIRGFLEEFERNYQIFLRTENLQELSADYNSLLVNCGREVRVLEPGNEYQAKALGINENGELIVCMEDGTQKTIYAGEVSVRGCLGYV